MDNYDDVDDSEEVYIDYNNYKDDGVGLESFYIYDYYTFLNHFYGTLLKKATNQKNFGTLYYLPILKLYFLQLTVLLWIKTNFDSAQQPYSDKSTSIGSN